ncbi:MAG TPA: GxxExxY protein, partial [Acetobacteraceae bacterium]
AAGGADPDGTAAVSIPDGLLGQYGGKQEEDSLQRHRGTEKKDIGESAFALSERVIGLAIEVHRQLGPGLLESAYEVCLAHELHLAGISFERQVELPVVYKGVRLDCGYRIDLLVARQLIVELKSVDRLLPVHDAQMLTYLRLSEMRTGLLMNFNNAALKTGLRRLSL